MAATALDQAVARLRADGAAPAVVAAFRHRFAQLAEPGAGLLHGDDLQPVEDLPRLADLPGLDGAAARALAGRLAVVKLNGGLGTTMALHGPKSLVEVRPGRTFLDVIAAQVLALRARHGVPVPLVLMDSFATRPATLRALRRHRELHTALAPDFLQSREPKLRADTLQPVRWPREPALEWCPPGHGDVYASLAGSGMLAAMRAAALDWAFVSNSDNLGAAVDLRVPAWAEARRAPWVLEAVRGTAADRKGGHLARRGGRLLLRESAQVPAGDPSFGDVARWRFYNTNNVWIDLRALEALLEHRPGGPELPLIVNRRTVDPADPSSPPVLQLESAMGTAVGAIAGARALEVPRARFAPVKSTDDLLVLRSDAYAIGDDGDVRPAFAGDPPVVTLDRARFGALAAFETRLPAGPPSLRRCRSLTVEGDVTFGAGVVVEGDVALRGPRRVGDGEVLRG